MSNFEHTTTAFKQDAEKTFAPIVDSMKNFSSKLEVPEAARDFVKRSADMATDRALDIHAGAAKATDAVESAATKTVSGLARVTRDMQAAAFDDAKAYLASVGKIADAKSISEAVQFQVEYLRERSEVTFGRAKSLFEFMSSSLSDGAKKAQENVAKLADFNKAA